MKRPAGYHRVLAGHKLCGPFKHYWGEASRFCGEDRSFSLFLAAIARLIAEWQPVMLVVGMPTYAYGSEHEMTRVAKNFARKLESRFNLPVFLVDERHTSTAAEAELHERSIHGKKNKALADAVAAQRTDTARIF